MEEQKKRGQCCWGTENTGRSGGKWHREGPGDLTGRPQVGVRITLNLTLCKAEVIPQGQEQAK